MPVKITGKKNYLQGFLRIQGIPDNFVRHLEKFPVIITKIFFLKFSEQSPGFF